MRKFGIFKNNDELYLCISITEKNEYIMSKISYCDNRKNMISVFSENDKMEEVSYYNLYIKDNILNKEYPIDFICYDLLLESFDIELANKNVEIHLHKELKSDWERFEIIVDERND